MFFPFGFAHRRKVAVATVVLAFGPPLVDRNLLVVRSTTFSSYRVTGPASMVCSLGYPLVSIEAKNAIGFDIHPVTQPFQRRGRREVL